MYATLLTLALAAPAFDPPTVHRPALAPREDAHQALMAEHQRARKATSELYHYVTHRPNLERQIAQKMVVDISKAVDASRTSLGAVSEALTPKQRKDVLTDTQLMGDLHAKAVAGIGDLKGELAKAVPDSREIRFHASNVYGALALAAEVHERVMAHLDLAVGKDTTQRAP